MLEDFKRTKASMDITFYKFIHLSGIILLFLSIGSILQNGILSKSKAENPSAKKSAMLHGTALLIILVSGFGMLAKLQIHWPLPGWVWAKVLIWFALGGLIAMGYKTPSLAKKAWILALALGITAAYFGLYK